MVGLLTEIPFGKQALMSESFDIYTLLFLVLAVVIFLRLKSVLGRRTGNEPNPNPYTTNRDNQSGNSNDTVVAMPGHEDVLERQAQRIEERSAEERVTAFVPLTHPMADGLMSIAEADDGFDPKEFMKGAKMAYEMIVTAFAAGNKKELTSLLSKDVFDSFSGAIDARKKRGETVDSSFVGIDKADITQAGLKGDQAEVTVRFESQLISAVRSKDGEIIEGDPNDLQSVTDIWTFAHPVKDANPNWKLVATKSAT